MSHAPPPLSLYIHTPWCERKCPYCDFNSYAVTDTLPQARYLRSLLADLECDLSYLRDREIISVFIGGGTPSLFSAEAISSVLAGVRSRLPLCDDAEITLEANPGSADVEKFAAFRKAGVNRLSIGVQSFNDESLHGLGRVHNAREAKAAFVAARAAGFDNINLDLMFALPRQSFAQGIADVEQVLSLAPEHISYYQLTLEPNTLFYAQPPALPDDDLAWRLETQARKLLRDAGYARYEVSAYAQAGYRCRHNLNYWRFGDYFGIGCGAHSKLTLDDGAVLRMQKHRSPGRYLDACRTRQFCAERRRVSADEITFEFMLNALRLIDGFDEHTFTARTGGDLERLRLRLERLEARRLIRRSDRQVCVTDLGLRFLNDVQGAFL